MTGLASLLALALAGTFWTKSVLARPACVSTNGYATFYNDHACTQNGGTAVSIANPGCLANEIDRNSIYIQPGCDLEGHGILIWSPGNECNCQNDCADVGGGYNDFCWDLQGHQAAQSFRFLTGQDCPANNC